LRGRRLPRAVDAAKHCDLRVGSSLGVHLHLHGFVGSKSAKTAATRFGSPADSE
jgi:hypothetical protein